MPASNLLAHPSFRSFVAAGAAWRSNLASATAVVDAAVALLLDDLDSPAVVQLAGLGRAEADSGVHELIEAAAAELGFDLLRYGDDLNDLLAAASLAQRYLRGNLEPVELTERIHSRFGHQCDPLIEELSVLDDHYDTLELTPNPTREQLDRRTHAAAMALVAGADERLRSRMLED